MLLSFIVTVFVLSFVNLTLFIFNFQEMRSAVYVENHDMQMSRNDHQTAIQLFQLNTSLFVYIRTTRHKM
jgi:hypothetical protein